MYILLKLDAMFILMKNVLLKSTTVGKVRNKGKTKKVNFSEPSMVWRQFMTFKV